ncbi:glycosyltransferase family 2 protein [Tellurirhabdus rosea]|uniref:glycosyltransferase family 2 protein n=1 Tax=Tellurirhabdus rosea TaxID=2674997 RepID=UPI00225BA27D|nr:glycosyltransferase [Tellurirhabdus rosea]
MHTASENPKELLTEYLSSRQPLVSVICTSFNHEPYIRHSLQSVIDQTYPAVELIVVDNNSTDRTVPVVEAFREKHSGLHLIKNSRNIGLARAFNQGLKVANGRFVIDLSADDVLHPKRIERQVSAFGRLPADYAVVFSNAALIDEKDQVIGHHFNLNERGEAARAVPSGSIFKEILESFVVCSPTMMMRREVLDSLGGYDETLAYEDFDFWVRSTKDYRYHYLDEVLTNKRVLRQSLSTEFSKPRNLLLPSTLKVCYKAFDQCQTPDEYRALAVRLKWSIRQCFYAQHYQLAFEFEKLLAYMEEPDWKTKLFLNFCRLRLPVNGLYRQYLNWQRKPYRISSYMIS